MQVMIDVPSEIGEQLKKLSKPELIRALRLVVQNGQPQQTIQKDKASRIRSYAGIAKGVYASAEEADKFIRKERDSWE